MRRTAARGKRSTCACGARNATGVPPAPTNAAGGHRSSGRADRLSPPLHDASDAGDISPPPAPTVLVVGWVLATTTRARFSLTDALPEASKDGMHYDEAVCSFVNALLLQYAAALPPPPWALLGDGDEDEGGRDERGGAYALSSPARDVRIH